MIKIDTISVYITKYILKYFIFILLSLFFVFLIVSIFESNDKIPFYINFKIILFKIPIFLETILHFIIYLSGLFVFYKLSNNNEFIIMRTTNKSLIQLIKFPLIIFFIFGIFIILVYNPISVYLNIKSEELENIYIKNEDKKMLEVSNRIWFREKNNNQELIISAKKVYKDTLLFKDVLLIYTNKNILLKTIKTESLELKDNKFIAINNFIVEKNNEKRFVEKLEIPTKLKKDFMLKIIEKDYESIYNVSFFKIKKMIKNLKSYGFDSIKFKIRYYYFLTIPFLFSFMILVSSYFGIINYRDNKKYISVIKGIFVGFFIYIIHNLITQLMIIQKLSIMNGTIWLMISLLILSTILLIKKDVLNNYD